MSSPELLLVDIEADDVLSLDGTYDHCKTSTLMMLSFVRNGRKDQMHKHHVLAFGVVSGHEPSRTVYWFLDLIMQARKKPFETLLWKVDGSLALREAIGLCYEEGNVPIIAMDYFHLMYGVRNHKGKLGNHYGNVCYHIRLLAETTDDYVSRGIQAVLDHWKRFGLPEFITYFEKTWVDKRPGWWCTSLGPGTQDNRWNRRSLALNSHLGGRSNERGSSDQASCGDCPSSLDTHQVIGWTLQRAYF
jgi:hypothetical protein